MAQEPVKRRGGKSPTRTQSTPALAMRLRYERLLHQLTQRDLADALGISVSQVQKYEMGRAAIPLDRLNQICTFMGLSPARLLEPIEPDMPELERLRDGITFAMALIHKADPDLRRSMKAFIESVLADQAARR